jgi:hypothetical protein
MLRLMLQNGHISKAAYTNAGMEPLRPRETFTETMMHPTLSIT